MKQLYFMGIVILLSAVLFINCGPDSSANEEENKVPVEVAAVQLGNVVQSLSYTGDIKAEFDVKVFSKIPDRIEKFFVEMGDRITKGAPIARIYATTIEQAVRQAQAGLAATKAQAANLQLEYDRAQRLYRENAMSKQQFEAIKTQYEAINAQVEQVEAGLTSARSQLGDATVTAPITGIIGKRYYEAGDMAAPTFPLVNIVQMDRVKISLDATENDLGKLAVGQVAVIKVKSYPKIKFKGSVTKISPVLDPFSRMAEVEIMVDNPGHKLKPGMFARVEITTGIIENIIVVPRHVTLENTSLERVDGKDKVLKNYYVFVVQNNKAIQRKLNVQYVNHKNIAVNAGISVGEQLVITGQNNLRDSSAVSVSSKKDGAL